VLQPDLFSLPVAQRTREHIGELRATELNLPALLDRLTLSSERPRYSFMVLTLIDKVADANGSAYP
jgi:hypothetical protein